MKTLKIAAIFFLLLIQFAVSGQSLKAARYSNRIIKKQHEITPMILSFLHTNSKKDFQKGLASSEIERIKIQKKIADCIEELRPMEAFEGNIELRDAALALLEFYKTSFEIDYKEMIALKSKKDKTEADVIQISSLKTKLMREEDVYDARLERAQEEFVVAHNLSYNEENSDTYLETASR